MGKVDMSALDRAISALCGQCCGEGELAEELDRLKTEISDLIDAATIVNGLISPPEPGCFCKHCNAARFLSDALSTVNP